MKLLNEGDQIHFAALIFSILLTTEAQGDRVSNQIGYIRSEQVVLKNEIKTLLGNLSTSNLAIMKGQDQLVNKDMKQLQTDIKSMNQSFISVKTKLDSFETKLTKLETGLDKILNPPKAGNPPKGNVSSKPQPNVPSQSLVSVPDSDDLGNAGDSSSGGDCSLLERIGFIRSGVYQALINGERKDVYCDMETDGGGWTMIQRREASSGPTVNFNRNWTDYENGFGDVNSSFWIGLKTMANLTKHWDKELRIDMEDWDGKWTYAKYSTFFVSGLLKEKYKLNVEGYTGNAGDSLSYHNNQFFSTQDKDNDNDGGNCAEKFKGGWWYSACHYSNLNGDFYDKRDEVQFGTGITWYTFKNSYTYSLKTVEMKIRYKVQI